MCLWPKTKSASVATQEQPQKTATPAEVGAARQSEDQALYGGVPDLRVDRTVTPVGDHAGSGLKVM